MKFFFVFLLSCFSLAAQNSTINTPNSLVFRGFSGFDEQFAMDAKGNVLATWLVDNGTNTVLQAAFKPFDGPWQTPGPPTIQANVITTLGFEIGSYQLLGDPQGNFVIIWVVFNGFNNVVQAAFKPVGQPFAGPGDPRLQQNILSFLNSEVESTVVADISSGNVVIAWQTFSTRNNTRVVQAVYKTGSTGFTPAGNPLFPQNNISPDGFSVDVPPVVAVDDFGNAIVAWEVFNNTRNVVQAVTRTPSSPFGTALDPRVQDNILSLINLNIESPPQADIEAGNALVIWEAYQQNILLIQTAFKPSGGLFQIPSFN